MSGPDILVLDRWARDAACRQAIADGWALDSWWFAGNPREAKAAKQICAVCPAREECLLWAMKNREDGIWGGLTRRERSQLPVQVRDCAECGAEFTYEVKGTGRHPATCSRRCRRRRRHKQQWASYERSGQVARAGLLVSRGHGTISRYHAGCKCAPCRRAGREYRDAYRAKAAS